MRATSLAAIVLLPVLPLLSACTTAQMRMRDGETVQVPVTCRLDTAEEVSIYEAGGVLQRFAQDFLEAAKAA